VVEPRPPGDPFDPTSLEQVETAVRTALESGSEEHLRVLGYGEITLVLGWPVEEPVWACKRLPVFADHRSVDRYRDLFERYLDVLRSRGIEPVPSELHPLTDGHPRAGPTGGGQVAYVVQPVLPKASLGPEVLRRGSGEEGERLLRTVLDQIVGSVDPGTGVDGQISNWAVVDGAVRYLDVTTPMLFRPDGRLELDVDLFLAAYPWLLRPPLRRFVVPGVVGAYRDPRHVLVDLAANLFKEGLAKWVPFAVASANERVTPPVSEDEVRRYYRSDARLWRAMLGLRRADRWWQHRVRRRAYPFLLPGAIDR
jgi:hypothetical protein